MYYYSTILKDNSITKSFAEATDPRLRGTSEVLEQSMRSDAISSGVFVNSREKMSSK